MFPTITIDRARTASAKFHTESRDLFGNTPLHAAVCKGQTRLAESLVGLGADVNSRDDAGATPLHQAVIAGDAEIAAMLIKFGADPNQPTDFGVSAVHLARVFGRFVDPKWRAILTQ